jgi:SPP1 family predicted phage head-tail adaptor
MPSFNNAGIRSGDLRQQITIVKPGTTPDSFGGTTPGGGTVLGTVWASVTALQGRDAVAAQSFSSIATHQIIIRYLAGVAANCQVMFGTRTFQIQAVLNPNELTKKLILLCVEINDSKQQGA